MACYGDPEAHRCILEEVAARPAAPRLIAYLRAAVMASQGSDVGIQQLRRFPGAVEQPGPHLKVTLSLLSMTVLASTAKPSFRREQQRVYETLARERASLMQQGEQLKTKRSDDGGVPLLWGVSSGVAANVSVNVASSDIGSASAVFAAAAGSVSFAPSSSGAEESKMPEEETLSPMQRWEQSMDVLNYGEAYANYLSGFTVLWYELFGPHYSYQPGPPLSSAGDGEAEAGGWASSSSPPSPPRQWEPQVPPHLYAVRWAEILTPQRRAWYQGLHNVVKELLVRILSRELPLELYALFILYANLSLRVYLLQTLAEVFEWTSHYLDVLCYVHVMRQSYSIQCEMSELQRVWTSFGLFDSRFIEDCREFNKMYTESQGAFSEQQVMEGNTLATCRNSTAPAGRSPMPAGPAARSSSGRAHTHPHSTDSSEETAAPRATPAFSPLDATSAVAVNTTASTSNTTNGAADTMQRIFPLRAAVGNASSDAADAVHSSASSSPDDEPLSSASEVGADTGTHRAKRAVYLPLFYTCCCFTWILQRSFWSMYGRCSLLLESCLGNASTPQVLRVEVKSDRESGGSTSALFAASSLGARRRGTAATSTATSTRALPIPSSAAAAGGGGGDRRVAGAAVGTAPSPKPTAAPHASTPPGGNLGQGSTGNTRLAGRPPQAPRTSLPQPPMQSEQHQQQAQSAMAIPQHNKAATQTPSNPPSSVQTPAAALPTSTPSLASEAASPSATTRNSNGGGETSGLHSRWAMLLHMLVPWRHQHHSSRRLNEEHSTASPVPGSPDAASASPPVAPATPQRSSKEELAATANFAGKEEDRTAAAAAASASLTCSGAPFFLNYTHRAREIQLYEDPSASCTGSGRTSDSDPLFFEEFHFLRETGCYVLSHALRNITCYPRYPATLLIFTDNTHRPGRVSWCGHKFSVLSSPVDDGEERRGLTPWVLCAVIPHTRLASNGAARAQQEERLLQHVAFQVAGAKSSRVRFCTANSIFFTLNGGADMDGGQLYFALHLHVPHTIGEGGHVSTEQVMQEESQWAFRELGELHCSWAMACTCNEALRVACQVGPVDDQAV
ncbi:hypothetical protein ABB37_00648 [Leptomonas pyrrhocoris]|uniref:Uncharacterized protein n=1 Tax=Leptomonas pyrrhocoris TaxID=157538 RepID=A0A0M9GAT1_LEPPY|nr:hypothetical protein ABB37_00648 [Leptomonas pyrrhocoris]KPA86500.1 hypothetical protein ABB37_00648 [Leptomonas pyrrhocoris]|eukprot:XP_015664939.1 hypothetical protein ABB37_00648 [Leptomonas pyrrhocoris]